MDRPATHAFARGALTGALLVAVAVNVVQFVAIDRQIGRIYAAVNRYPTDDLADLGVAHSPTVKSRFQLYLELRRWAPGADLVVSPGAGLQEDQLVGLGGVGDISGWDGELELTDELTARIDAHVVAEGEDRHAGPFALAVQPAAVDRLVTARDGDRLLLIDDRLLEDGGA